MNYSKADFKDNQLIEGYKNIYDIKHPVVIARSRIRCPCKKEPRETVVKMTPVHDIHRKEVIYRPSNSIESFTNIQKLN